MRSSTYRHTRSSQDTVVTIPAGLVSVIVGALVIAAATSAPFVLDPQTIAAAITVPVGLDPRAGQEATLLFFAATLASTAGGMLMGRGFSVMVASRSRGRRYRSW